MVASVIISYLVMFALLGWFLVINSILVFNSIRYMAVAPSVLWRDSRYVQCLPNFLKHLYDAGFTAPWPVRPSAFSAWKFRRRLQTLLQDAFPDARQLIQHHLTLWAFVQLHRGELRQVIRNRQIQRARQILADSLDAETRGRMLAFLNQCQDTEPRAARKGLTPASTCGSFGWLARLRTINVLLREHGYQVCAELCTLEHWEDADDGEILHELSPSAAKSMNPAFLK